MDSTTIIKMTRKTNGYTIDVKLCEDGEITDLVYQESEGSEFQSALDILYEISEIITPCSGKYSKERIYISVLPGYDHEDFDKDFKEAYPWV